MGRLIAERKLAAIARRRARAAVGETASRLKDEVAKQVAQIDDDRAYAVRPTFQIPPNWKCTHLNAPTEFYKVVACVNERFVSVYDGATEYELGRWYQTKRGSTWPPLDQCFFAFSAPLGALEAAFPRGSKAKHAPRVLLKIEAVGNAYECHETKRKGMASKWTGKVAVTRFPREQDHDRRVPGVRARYAQVRAERPPERAARNPGRRGGVTDPGEGGDPGRRIPVVDARSRSRI